MTTASSQITSVSLRGVQILALNSIGVPAATLATEYAGLRIVGSKALTLNIPERQTIVNTGDDRILAQFSLPAQEGVTGELRVGAFDMTAEALVSGITIKVAGEQNWLHSPTQVKTLPRVCLLGWREAKSVTAGDDGRGHYEAYLIHSATMNPRGGSAEERTSEERSFGIVTDVVSRLVWGEALVEGTDGIDKTDYSTGSSEYVPRIAAFYAAESSVVVEFELTVDAVSDEKMQVYTYDGTTFTDVTSTVTLAVDSVTFSVAPDDIYIIVVYEVAS